MKPVATPLFRSGHDQPVTATRRGVCPSLSKPMQTGDGLLVRLRPASGGLSPHELITIAEASARFGNGILEVTARGNLQLRGLKPETVDPLTDIVFASGIELATGLAVETPPLSGADPDEIIDARPLAARLRAAVLAEVPQLRLAAKLSITVDGGGSFNLDGLVADIRLKGQSENGTIVWALSLGGNAGTARPVALLEDHAVTDVVLDILRMLHATGPSARGRDIDPMLFGNRGEPFSPGKTEARVRRPAGLHPLSDGTVVAGFGLAFCQISASDLVSLAHEAARLGIADIRLAPEHGFLVPGLCLPAAKELLDFAGALGLGVSPEDPANAIALCAGTKGCASAFFDTHAAARLIIKRAPELLDGSFDLHLSGCQKGCAHPAPSVLALAGAPLGYAVVVNGPASASPQAYIAANDVISAMERLSSRVRSEKEAGESARSCLTRLGLDEIAAALRQE